MTEISKLKDRIENGSSAPSAPPPTAAFTAETGKSSKKGMHTVEAWRLDNKGPETTHDGRKYYWCTEPHFDNGVKKAMYVTHLPGDHNFWNDYNACKDNAKKSKMMEERSAKRD